MRNSFTLARPANNIARRLSAQAGKSSPSNSYIEVRGTRVRYVESGSPNTGAPLLMVHGYNGSCDYWFPRTLSGLAVERRVIAFDLPGNGWSGDWERYSLEAYAGFVPDFMDALGIEQADLLGHSMGGFVAMAAAAGKPGRFRKLVLVDSAGARRLRLGVLHSLRMLGDPSVWQVRMYPTFARVALKGRAVAEGLHILRAGRIANAGFQRLALPTLVIWGERDRLIPPEHGAHIAQNILGATHVVISGAGHMPFYEKPREFLDHVLTFLR
jgi:pimeloyl-ACP methyl ester carboxylesterase